MVNPKWAAEIEEKLDNKVSLDEVISFNPASQWLIIKLSYLNKPFKIYNLGSGVKRITTETDTCPCCKKKI